MKKKKRQRNLMMGRLNEMMMRKKISGSLILTMIVKVTVFNL